MYAVSSTKPANRFHLRVRTGSQKRTIDRGVRQEKCLLPVYLGLKGLSSLHYSSKNNYIITVMSSFSYFFVINSSQFSRKYCNVLHSHSFIVLVLH